MGRDCPLIAIVDDEESVRKALGRLLVSAGLAVETFGGGGEFLRGLSAHRPDCLVLDLHMPEVSGFDVLARLAAIGGPVPVVTITGHDTAEAEELALSGGASAYLRKPVTDHVLLAAIAAVLVQPAQDPGQTGQTPESPPCAA